VDLTSFAPYIVGAGGIVAGVYATFQSSKAAKRSLSAEEKARAFTAADEMIENLQEDNAALRTEMRTVRQEHAAEIARMVEEHRLLRAQCQENDARNTAAIQSLQQDNANLRRDLYDMTASLVGLRALVVDEVAREAAPAPPQQTSRC
jgi:predicted RNase H-like nuclease (RuvC/YqgF family)